MPGCSVQWYGNVPADENVLLKVPPGAIGPESQVALLPVDVWVTESLLVHVTVPPTVTAIGLGA